MKDGSSSQAPQWAGGLRQMLARQLSSPGELSLLESPRLPVKARRGKWKEGIRYEPASVPSPRDGADLSSHQKPRRVTLVPRRGLSASGIPGALKSSECRGCSKHPLKSGLATGIEPSVSDQRDEQPGLGAGCRRGERAD